MEEEDSSRKRVVKKKEEEEKKHINIITIFNNLPVNVVKCIFMC